MSIFKKICSDGNGVEIDWLNVFGLFLFSYLFVLFVIILIIFIK